MAHPILVTGASFYTAAGAGFVTDHKAQGDRLDFGHLFKAYRDQFPFLVGGSNGDPFEHRQVDLAEERLGKLGLQIEVTSGRMSSRKPWAL